MALSIRVTFDERDTDEREAVLDERETASERASLLERTEFLGIYEPPPDERIP
jgi:hypothetical protein